MKLKEKVLGARCLVLAAALVAGAGASAWAEDAPEEEVVAFGEAEFWLGGDEVAVASGEGEFWLGPDEIAVASGEKTFWLGPEGLRAARPDKSYTVADIRRQLELYKAQGRRYRRGEIFSMSGAKEKLVAFVMSGILHVKMSSVSGEDLILGAARPGDFVGLMHVYEPDVTCAYDVVAFSDLGVNRCALSRVIGQLSADGEIRCSRNVITVL